jgi:DNA-binding SARP family transcriptional activator/tetratricopeptide (TPR) repeat protein
VEVVGDDGQRIGLSPKERLLLARLAGGHGATVSDGTLVEALWATPPATAVKTLQGLVYHVRQLLGQDVILREGSGYRLAALRLDLDIAQQAWASARVALDNGEREVARDTLRSALGLFRGAPFTELDDDVTMSGVRRRVTELRLALAQLLFELDLHAGGTPALIGELEVLVNDDPTRERTWCLLVSALASSGRHADALNAIARARRALALELGIGPGPELLQLEHDVLEHRVPPAAPASTPVARRRLRLPGPLAARGDEVPLVGRSREVAACQRAFQAAVNTPALHVQLLIGEPGVGKTRLATECARDCAKEGALVLFGRCSETVSSPFEPLLQVLEHVVDGGSDSFVASTIADRVRSLIDRLSAERTAAASDTTPAAERHQLFEELASVVGLLAADSPVVIVLDDLHWASNATVMALTHLVRRSPSLPILFVMTARVPEFGGSDVLGQLGAEPPVRVQHLSGLDAGGVAEYLAALGDGGAEGVSAADLHRRTGGNVFLLGELARSAHTSGTAGGVPDLVRNVIVARARRLPDPTLDVLHLAAVIGLEFELPLLVRAAQLDETTVVASLDAALQAQLVVEHSSLHMSYAFAHALTRDALVSDVSKARQAIIHRQIASALESASTTSLAAVGRLAHHLLRCTADDARLAGCGHAVQAAERSMTVFAYDDAVEWFSAALDASATLPMDDAFTSSVQLGLARAATLSGDERRARGAAEQAWRTARLQGDRATEVAAVLLYAGEPELNVVGDEPGTVMLAATADLPGLRPAERARVMARLSSAISFIDQSRATELAETALDLATRECEPADLAYVMRCRMRGWFDPDCVAERLAMARQVTAIGRELDDGVTESWGWRWQSVTLFEYGDTAGIEHCCRQVALLAERLHLPNQCWSAAFRMAAVRVFQGRFDDAEALLAEAVDHSRKLDNALTADIEADLTDILDWFRGLRQVPPRPLRDQDRWTSNVDQPLAPHLVEALARQLDVKISQLDYIASYALIADDLHPDVARVVYESALRHLDHIGVFSPGVCMLGSMQLYAGLLARALGDTDLAVDHFREAVAVNTRLGALPFIAFAAYELAATLPHNSEAHESRARANDIARRLGIPWLES